MLIYTHAFDKQHASYRLLLLFNSLDGSLISEQIRIFDFMLAFPSFLQGVRKTRRVKIRSAMNKYEFAGSFQQCFFLMEQPQISSLLELVSRKLIIKDGPFFKRNNKYRAIFDKISLIEQTSEQMEALGLIVNMLNDIEVRGKNGLKNRANLMESIYDPSD